MNRQTVNSRLGGIGKLFFFSLFFLLSVLAQAQNWNLIMEFTVTDDGKKMPGADIVVKQNGRVIDEVKTDAKGKAEVMLPPNGDYSISISGRGKIKKLLSVDTRGVNPEDIEGEPFFPAEVNIYDKIDGLDYSLLNKPIGIIRFDPSFGSFDADPKYTKSMKAALDQLEADFQKKKADEAKRLAENKKLYDEAVKKADKAFEEEDWVTAKAEYEKAAKYDPLETYPTFQLAELETKLIKVRETEKKYQDAIKTADDALAAKDYKIAIAAYRRASGIKPKETYPKEKIESTEAILAGEAKNEQEYLTAITKGDQALAANKIEDAKAAFTQASSIKPDEAYPKNKLAEIEAVAARQAEKEKAYQLAIGEGDNAIKEKEYEKAKTAYTKAIDIKPTEKYPQDQLAKIDDLIAKQKAQREEYLAAISEADAALQANKLQEAKGGYEKASKIIPEEDYPKLKISEIDKMLADQAEQDKNYDAAIKEGDGALASGNYEDAMSAYQKASGIKPAEAYPKDKIAEIEKTLADQAAKEQEYKDAIAKADAAFKSEDYPTAKTAYQEASGIKPDEQYPKDQLSQIETIVVQMAEKDEAYNKAIADGDQALGAKDYENAKKAYESAASIKPEEAYPKDKLAEVNQLIADAQQLDADYQAAIDEGDNAQKSGDLEGAKAAFTKAIGLKANEQYPKDKIAEIDGLLASAAELDANYKAAIDKADQALAATQYESAKSSYEEASKLKPEEAYPKDKIKEIEATLAELAEKDGQYNDAIKAGDKALASEDYENAKSSYEQASGIKPDESYPKDKIAEIEAKLAEIAQKEEEIRLQQAAYDEAIKKGDDAFGKEALADARAAYNEALKVKPEESYPADQLKKIDEKEAQLAAEKEAAEKQAALDQQYADLIAKADQALAANDYPGAKTDYQAAAELKPEEAYPKEKIAEIDQIVAALAEKDANYQAAIEKADQAFNAEDWENAKQEYQAALAIKGEEQYPKDKIAAIDAKLGELAEAAEEIRLQQAAYDEAIKKGDDAFGKEALADARAAYDEALKLKPEESYPADQLKKIDEKEAQLAAEAEAAEKQAALDQQYADLIAKADQALASNDYATAKADYQSAADLKADEQYPKDKIAEIEKVLADNEAREANYQSAIEKGDQALAAEDLQGAKSAYESALGIKADEQYPKDKIAEIDQKLAELAQKEEEIRLANEKQAEIDANYQAAIDAGDKAFDAQSLTEARTAYQNAQQIKPEESYPQQRLDEIVALEQQLADQAAQAEAEKKAAEIQQQYDDFIAQADAAFDAQSYKEAVSAYQSAQQIKPEESYPKQRMDEISAIEAQLAEKAAQEEAEKQAAAVKAEYDKLIAQADGAFAAEDYAGAKLFYQDALNTKSDETYPQQKIDEINSLLDQQAKEAEAIRLANEQAAKLDADYQAAIATADNAFDAQNWQEAKSSYEQALALKADESYPQQRIQQIDERLAQLAKEAAEKEAAEAERLAAINQQYQEIISRADIAYEAADFENAKTAYEEALAVKPDEAYPKSQLDAIAAAKADAARKAEEIRLANERAAKVEADFQAAIATGDQAFEAKNWQAAITAFQEASDLKPSESYPQERIAAIQRMLDAKAAAEAEAERKQREAEEREAQFGDLIANADRAFDSQSYRLARRDYQAALKIKPSESHPQAQLAKIEKILEKIRQEELAAKKAEEEAKTPVRVTKAHSKVDPSAEDRLEKMYQEMWAKRIRDKGELVAEENRKAQEQVAEENEMGAEKRKNAVERLDDIAITLTEEREKSDKMYEQNQVAIDEKQEVLKEVNQEWRKEDKQEREVEWDELTDFAQREYAYKKDRTNENLANFNEAVVDRRIELKDTEKEWADEQEIRINEEEDEFIRKADDIRTEEEARAADHLSTGIAYDEHQKRTWEKQKSDYIEDFEPRQEKALNNVTEKQEAQAEFLTTSKTAMEENQRQVDEQAEVLRTEVEESQAENAKEHQEHLEKDFYEGEKRLREDDLSNQYPQGVSEEIIENQDGSTTIRRIVTNKTQSDVYEKTFYTWGKVFYTKNGNSITQEAWDQETNP